MHPIHRLRRLRPILWLILLVLPGWYAAPAGAVSITGIMLYSTDDHGNPSGTSTFTEERFEAQTWRTMIEANVYGLGVIEGLPPESVNRPFLNYPDFSLEVALDEGENYFTVVGEAPPIEDVYDRFAVNLYFDGDQTTPGISVLFPRNADPDGSPVAESRAYENQVYGLLRQPVNARPKTYYDDGFYRVSVLRASFLSAERANVSVDRMMTQSQAASGTSDWVGSLVVMVEPSESFGPAGGPRVPVAGGGGGGGSTGTSGGGIAPGAGGPGFVPSGPLGGPAVAGEPARGYEDDSTGGGAADTIWHEGDKYAEPTAEPEVDADADADGTPTPADLVNALQQWLAAAATQTPGGDGDDPGEADGTPEPTQHGDLTPTPQPGTPTVGSTITPSKTPANAPTPVSTASEAAAAGTTPTPAQAEAPKPAAE